MQTSLLKSPPPATLPVDCGYYVPALQNRSGELKALEKAPIDVWEKMVPLIQCVGPKQRATPLSAASVRAWMSRIKAAVGSRPFYLDVLRLRPNFPVKTPAGKVPVLEEMYAAARRRDLCFIPVAWVGKSTKSHLNLVANAAVVDENGVALRYRFRDIALPPGTTQGTYLSDCLTDLNADVGDADLILDLGYIDPDVEIDASDIAELLKEVRQVGNWRSLVLIGSSTPKSLGCVKEGTVGKVDRREWVLYSELQTLKPDRLPAYGDYAVQHPQPPMEPGGPGMRANIRYTVKTEMLVARGEGLVIQEGKEQYRELCQWLKDHADFLGEDFSWGDQAIVACAEGLLDPGWQALWRGAGTSHHFRFVTGQVPSSPT
jgi:hypothetical protein